MLVVRMLFKGKGDCQWDRCQIKIERKKGSLLNKVNVAQRIKNLYAIHSFFYHQEYRSIYIKINGMPTFWVNFNEQLWIRVCIYIKNCGLSKHKAQTKKNATREFSIYLKRGLVYLLYGVLKYTDTKKNWIMILKRLSLKEN